MVERFTHRVGSPNDRLGRPPRFYASDVLHSSGCRFASVYAVREEDAKAIEETAGTAATFRGIVWSRRLWVDFDNFEAADRAEVYLRKEGYDHVVYDTGGGRGRHVGILRLAAPSHTLPLQDKLWVAEYLPGADLGLYWHLHLLRLPGALHERTGLPKRILRRTQGRELALPPYTPEEAVPVAPEASGQRQSIFKTWGVMSQVTETPGESRHDQLVAVAMALKRDAHVNEEEALWVVQEVNRGFGEPKGLEEVQRVVRWAYEQEG